MSKYRVRNGTWEAVMVTSYNGWPASPDRSSIDVWPMPVHGEDFPGGVKADDVTVVMRYIADQFHRRVEKIHPGWCWGFAYRENRNASNMSCHASGTAIDINAPAHPNGVPTRETFSTKQIEEIRDILEDVGGGVVRWGGDYSGVPDAMHFEINVDREAVHRAAERIKRQKRRRRRMFVRRARARRNRGTVHSMNLRPNLSNRDVREVQKVLNEWFPHHQIAVDGRYGPATKTLLDRARKSVGLPADVTDRSVRRRTLRKLGFKTLG